MSTFWSYQSTSPLTLCPQSSWISAGNKCPKLGILTCSDVSLSEVTLILLHTLRTWVSCQWYTWCDIAQTICSSSIVWRCNRWVLGVLCCWLVADSRLKTVEDSILYHPWSGWCESVSYICSRPVHRSLCLSICEMSLTLLLDHYTFFTLAICSLS
jgi:hypothetical protein